MLLVVGCIVLLGTVRGDAQPVGTGEITGGVFEDLRQNGPTLDDQPLVGATVILTRPDSSTVATLTDGAGRYSFAQLGGGLYSVSVEQSTLPNVMYATFDSDGGNDNSIQIELIAETPQLPAQLIGPASSDFGLTRGTVVCVEMKVAVDAPATETPADFALLLNGDPAPSLPTAGPIDLGVYSLVGSCGSAVQPDAAEFSSGWVALFVEPFQPFELTQVVPDGAISRSRLRACEAFSTYEVTFENSIVHTPASPIFLNCTFANDVAIVCAQTMLFPGAAAAGHTVDQFPLSITDDAGSPIGGQSAVVPSGTAASDCFTLPQSPSGFVRLIAPLGEPFILTQALPGGSVGPMKSFCGPETTAQRSSTVAFTPNPQHDEPNLVFCLFANDVVTVCVHADIGVKSIEAGVTASDFMATITNGAGQVIGGQQNVVFDTAATPCDGFNGGLGETGTVRFFAPPGESFTVTQSPISHTVPAGPTGSWCGFVDLLQIGPSATYTPNPASLELQARVTCVMLAGSIDVCVVNEVGPVAALLGVQPDEFTISLNDVANTTISTAPVTVANPFCAGNDAARFFVAPGAAGYGVSGSGDSRVSLSQANCSTYDAFSGPLGTTAGSSFDTNVKVASVTCTLVQETALVCVQNSVGPAAHQQLGVSTTAYTTQLLDQNGIVLGDEHRVAGDLSQVCGLDTSVPGADVAVAAFMVGPGDYMLAQTGGTDNRVGLTTIGCSSNGSGPLPGTNSPALTAVAGTPTNCLIFNDTLPVCMAKVLLDPTTGEPASSLLGYGQLDWTLSLHGDSTTFSTPAATDFDCLSKISEKADGVLIYVPMVPGSLLELGESTVDPRIGPIGTGVCVVWNGPVDPITIGALEVPQIPLPGDSAGCEITNSTVPIDVRKVVVNDFAGELGPADFELRILTTAGQIIDSGIDTTGQGITLHAAPFSSISITEVQQPGYLASVTCSFLGAGGGTKTSKVALNGDLGLDGMDCTITNRDVRSIPVCAIKDLDAGLTSFTHDDFTLILQDGNGATVGSHVASVESDETCAALNGGVLLAQVFADGQQYTIGEEAAASVGARIEQVSATCVVAGAVSDLGDFVGFEVFGGATAGFAADPEISSVTCTLVNRAVPVPVVVTKQLGDDAGDAAVEDFLLEIRNSSGEVIASGNGFVLLEDIAPGSYSITESGPEHYLQTDAACNGVAGTSFTVDSSTTTAIGCFIENSHRPPMSVLIDVVIQGGDATVDQVQIQITDEDGNVIAEGVDPSADLFDGFTVELPAGTYCVLVASLQGYELIEFTMTVGDTSNQLNPLLDPAGKRNFTLTNGDGSGYGRAVFAPITEPAVSVTKTVSDTTVEVNKEFTWTLTATNVSTVDATNVLVTDELPEGLEVVLPLPDGLTYNGATRLVRFAVGDLAVGESASLSFGTTATTAGLIVNTAFVTADVDVTDGDNESRVDVVVKLPEEGTLFPRPNPEPAPEPSPDPDPAAPPLAIASVQPVIAISQLSDSITTSRLSDTGAESKPVVSAALLMIGLGSMFLGWDVHQGRNRRRA